ncbi:BNR repeat domain protein [Leucobacter sp. 7(1)]|nr:BNR repeat domain protein [Leucobacter sp. 7(1)]
MTSARLRARSQRQGLLSFSLLLLGAGAVALSASSTSAAYTSSSYAHTDDLTAEIPAPLSVGLSPGQSLDTGSGVGNDGNAYVWGRTDMSLAGGAAWGGTWKGPTRVGGLPEGEVAAVSGQIYGFNALQLTGEVWGWGNNPERDGTGAGRLDQRPERLRVGSNWNGNGTRLTDIALIASTEQAGAGIRSDGSVWAWGDPSYGGFFGNGAKQVPGLPDPLANDGEQFPVYITGGYQNFWVILNSGEVWYWGGASSTPGADKASNSGARVSTALAPWFRAAVGPGDGYITRIAGGKNLGLAVLSDGRVLTWGGSGRIGNRPTPPAASEPGLVNDTVLRDIVDATSAHTGALLRDSSGNLFSYGAADDVGSNPRTPTLLDTEVIDLAAGQGHYIWRKANGEYWGKGFNAQGALGTPLGSGLRKLTLDLGVLD